MIKEIIMPKLGETMEDGIINKWLKNEGDKVERGEPLFEVVTDKATFEAESPANGYLRKIVQKSSPDKKVEVLKVIGYVSDSMDEKIPETTQKTQPQKDVVAELARQDTVATDSTRQQPIVVADLSATASRHLKASPLAKKIAKEKGIDISLVAGTGPGGRILERDVLAFKAQPAAVVGGFTPVALTQMRKVIAERLSQSKHDAPHYYLQAKINMTEIVALRESMIKETNRKSGTRISYNDIIIYAAGKVLPEFKEINSHFINGEVRCFNDVNIGIAVAARQGLVVPVIKQVNRKSVQDVCLETDKIQEKAKNNKFSPDDFTGGTFTISNLGMYDVDVFTAIINPPQVGILAVGKIDKGVVIKEDNLKVGYFMKVSLSLDHRVIDGAYGARFLKKFKDALEKPYPSLLDRRTRI